MDEMTLFHADDYVHFLSHVNPDNSTLYQKEILRCTNIFFFFYVSSVRQISLKIFFSRTDNVDVDCPVFDGLWKFCQLYTGGSVGTDLLLRVSSLARVLRLSTCLHFRRSIQAEPRRGRHCYQLGWWSAPRQEIRSQRLLLCERHRVSHSRTSQVCAALVVALYSNNLVERAY